VAGIPFSFGFIACVTTLRAVLLASQLAGRDSAGGLEDCVAQDHNVPLLDFALEDDVLATLPHLGHEGFAGEDGRGKADAKGLKLLGVIVQERLQDG